MNRILPMAFASISLLLLALVPTYATAQASPSEVPPAPEETPPEPPENRLEIGSLRLKISGVFFGLWGIDLENANPSAPSPNGANRFDVTRAYINIEPQISENISLRITPDLTRVSRTEGNLDGSLALRLKYAYAQFTDVLPALSIKAGIQQTAWIDFEDSVWGYRVLGPAALEFFTGTSSADLGVGVLGKPARGLFEYQLVLVNGEGYSRSEQNSRDAAKYKDAAGRITWAPFATSGSKALERLKLTAFAQYGIKGNVDDGHLDRIRALGMASYQHSAFTVGVSGGPTWEGEATETGGVTTRQGLLLTSFAHVNLPLSLRALGRFDWYDPDVDSSPEEDPADQTTGSRSRLIAGLAYRFNDKVQLIADYQAYGFEEARNAPVGALGKVFFFHLEARY